MKPLKLILSAFGPYAGTAWIFRKPVLYRYLTDSAKSPAACGATVIIAVESGIAFSRRLAAASTSEKLSAPEAYLRQIFCISPSNDRPISIFLHSAIAIILSVSRVPFVVIR